MSEIVMQGQGIQATGVTNTLHRITLGGWLVNRKTAWKAGPGHSGQLLIGQPARADVPAHR